MVILDRKIKTNARYNYKDYFFEVVDRLIFKKQGFGSRACLHFHEKSLSLVDLSARSQGSTRLGTCMHEDRNNILFLGENQREDNVLMNHV
jgi:hypothetical protein